jgi:HKD family nuclease
MTSLQKELTSARQFKFATALVKMTGVDLIHEPIRQCMNKGGRGEILVGIDLPSDPNAIQRLAELGTEYSGQLKLKYFRHLKNLCFHPKVFWFKGSNGKTSVIVGSSNLTGGGLVENYEANILVRVGSVSSKLAVYFDEHFHGAYSSDVTSEWIAKYRSEWEKRQKFFARLSQLRRKAQVAARRSARNSLASEQIEGRRIAFTGKIKDWPRKAKLYPKVERLGGQIVEVDQIVNADYLVHAELMGGRKTTRKLRGARNYEIPVFTQEHFFDLVDKTESKRKKELSSR